MLLSMKTSAVRNQDEQVGPATACCCSSGGAVSLLGSGAFCRTPPHCLSAYLEAQTSHQVCCSAIPPVQDRRWRNLAYAIDALKEQGKEPQTCQEYLEVFAKYGWVPAQQPSAAQRARKMRFDQLMAVCGGVNSVDDYPAKGEPDAPAKCEGCRQQGGSGRADTFHAWGDATVPTPALCWLARGLSWHSPADRLSGVLAAVCCLSLTTHGLCPSCRRWAQVQLVRGVLLQSALLHQRHAGEQPPTEHLCRPKQHSHQMVILLRAP